MEVEILKFFKKAIAAVLVLCMATSMVACSSKKENPKMTNEKKTEKIEYITKITKDNVEDIVIEYKEILSYYNDLKNNLKAIDDIAKNPDLESEAANTKDSINNGLTLLSGTQTLYKPLVDAKSILIKMYRISLDMADYVVSNPSEYEKKSKEYQKLFDEFKSIMDTIRTDVEKVRGKSPTEDIDIKSDDKNDNKKDDKNNKSDVKDKKDDKTSDKKDNSSNKNNSGKNNPPSNDGSANKPDQEFVPKVSSLNSSLRGEIKNAGFSAGASYKQSGGDSSNLSQVAAQMFNDIEGDNPINSNDISEARQIFINAFISAYNSN